MNDGAVPEVAQGPLAVPEGSASVLSGTGAMPELELVTVTRTQGNNEALKDGRVRPRDFAFTFKEVDPLIAAFRRMVREQRYDVCEMAMSTYLTAREHGKRSTAIPVFLVRAFHHGAILHNVSAGIRSPKDLEGRR